MDKTSPNPGAVCRGRTSKRPALWGVILARYGTQIFIISSFLAPSLGNPGCATVDDGFKVEQDASLTDPEIEGPGENTDTARGEDSDSDTDSNAVSDTEADGDTASGKGTDTASDVDTDSAMDAGPITDTDQDTETSHDDQPLPSCPYLCLPLITTCGIFWGEAHAGYRCPGDLICCET